MQKPVLLFSVLIVLLSACRSKQVPDVSGIKVPLTIHRFEQDFFALDTNHILPSLQQLNARYPGFTGDFLTNILGLPPITDTSVEVEKAIRRFLADYRPVKDSADRVFANINNIEKEIHQALQFVQHYFPSYKAPAQLITFIGPMDAFYQASLGGYGDVITREGMAVGLQLHLGSNFSMYQSPMGQSLYPLYISRRFTPAYIPVNCIKNIIDDIYPGKLTGRPLIEQMVEKGKRLYVLDLLMPYTPDTLKIGYTENQLKGCYANEGRIWNFFLTNSMLFTTEPALLKGYIDDAPNTPELGDASPGAIGQFCGWQIVKKYMDKNPGLTLPALLQTDARKIFEDSKYRPN